jgi:hypothetical protein
MNPPVRRARIFSATLCSVVAVAIASGQGNRDLATAHSQAMAEFQAGNYTKAAMDLEALVEAEGPLPAARMRVAG